MANQWGSTNVNEWAIAGSHMQVTVTIEPTDSLNPLVFTSLRANNSSIPALSTLDVVPMGQSGFIARTQTTDGSEITQDMITQADLHIDWLVHD